MSEGINFSDGMARLVVMIGLPFPNPNDAFLIEKMKYINEQHSASVSNMSNDDKIATHKINASNEYLENICMRSVNQSIGRSIRHKDDYSVILLLDNRYYLQERIQKKLPNWIRGSLQVSNSFGQSFAAVSKFFNAKKGKQTLIEQKREEIAKQKQK